MSTLLTNEKMLTQRLKQGDEGAFSSLFKVYSPVLQSFLQNFNLPTEDINDIIQTTFLKIWESRDKIDNNQSFKNYIITIAKNDLYHQIQKNIVRQRNEHNLKESIAISTEIQSSELFHILEKILTQLPEKRREVFRMNRVEGYSNASIAEELGISKSTVENHINNSSAASKRTLKNIGFSSIISFFTLGAIKYSTV